MIKIGLLGSNGRMGKWVSRLVETEFVHSAVLTAQAGREDLADPLLKTDVVIDFSSPTAMTGLAQLALKQKGELPAFVVGSTGWRPDQRKVLDELGTKTPILMSSVFSTGMMAILEILKQSAPLLEKLKYTPVIVETHHRHKKDAPSGVALALQRTISPNDSIQTHSIRAGEIIGKHQVTYYGAGDHIIFEHIAQDRSIFARGAIEISLWLSQHKHGSSALRGVHGIEKYFDHLKENIR